MRKVKKLAQTLKSVADDCACTEVASTPKKPKTLSKALTSESSNHQPSGHTTLTDARLDVNNGRVSKTSPTKGKKKAVKQEAFDSQMGGILGDSTLFAGEGMGAEMLSFGGDLALCMDEENFFG